MYKPTEIATLIKKNLDGNLTSDERLRLQDWAQDNAIHKGFLDKVMQGDMVWQDALKWMELEDSDQGTWEKELERKLLSKVATTVSTKMPRRGRILTNAIPYAAAILLLVAIGMLYFTTQNYYSENPVTVYNLQPGGNKAQLTLEDGRSIELSSQMDGIIVGDKLTYNNGTAIPLDQPETVSMATLTTPRGGTYQITLPDGTKVWLNAASTLTYPSRFSEEERVVKLEGEAYFEVAKAYTKKAKGKAHNRLPFLVKTSNQVIEVLGTQFNVMAYSDETATKTTLIEGLVSLKTNKDHLKLVPGEQGILHNATFYKTVVDVNQQTAWKDSKFIFYETELQEAMKDLSRWYNLDVVYEGKIPIAHFYGEISRNDGLAEVLKILKVGGVKFRIEKIGEKNRLIVLS